jgi:YHS domain-containing protein
MTAVHPPFVVDPICGMTVEVDHAEAAGLTVTHEGRVFAFCGPGCLRSFTAEPDVYAAKAATAQAAASGGAVTGALPIIDEGMRRWYESCSCCLSDAYPDIKAALDAERAAQSAAPPEPGICEVAEASHLEPVV